MRVVVVGASGNVGTSVLRELADEPAVDSVVGAAADALAAVSEGPVALRRTWQTSPLEPLFRGADAVVHLAWLIQPGRDRELTRRVNVGGSERVFQAVARAGVPALIYASSVGTYAPGPKDRRVDETWPVDRSRDIVLLSRDKAAVEALLDSFEEPEPGGAGGAAPAGIDLLARC